MLIFGNSQKFPDDSSDLPILQHLSPRCVLWLNRQSEALGQSASFILQQVLKEWLTTHAIRSFDEARLPEIAQIALSEFIARHEQEFISV
ncbi:MAG: hypothetical protein JO308_00045 [Verrucomicrobia bacterium]|nr:hypothetical protein [Verrucomicrobiota bacterium]